MTDIWPAKKRSRVMSKIRSRDTGPEKALRGALRRNDLRFRQHRKVAGVSTDFVLPAFQTVVLVHGCFWHGCKKHYTPPSDNSHFWSQKLFQNRRRDARQARIIRGSGWRLVIVWEHSLTSSGAADRLVGRLLQKLREPQRERPRKASSPRFVPAGTDDGALSPRSPSVVPGCSRPGLDSPCEEPSSPECR